MADTGAVVAAIETRAAKPAWQGAPFVRRGLTRLLREPLFHFVVLGGLLFAASYFMEPGRSRVEPTKQIQLTVDDLRQLDLLFQSQWRRPPTSEEFARLVESKVQEEVLYREGLAMGLDKDDTIVKRRMAQKMQFLAEDVAAAREPTAAELKAWYEKNNENFALPSRVSFRHLYFSPDRRGQRAHDDASMALGAIAGQPGDSPRAAALADPFMFQAYYGDRTPDQLAKEFGPTFARAVEQVKPGSWQGPLESGYGWHVVFVDSVTPGRVQAFEEIEPDVKTAWLADQKQRGWRKAYEAMRAKYTVALPVAPDNRSAKGSATSSSGATSK